MMRRHSAKGVTDDTDTLAPLGSAFRQTQLGQPLQSLTKTKNRQKAVCLCKPLPLLCVALQPPAAPPGPLACRLCLSLLSPYFDSSARNGGYL